MNQIHAVVGFLPDAIAKASSQGQHHEPLEVRLDSGNGEMFVKVNANDVSAVLLGAAHKGQTSVQVLLKENAKVDTVVRGTASDLFLRAISDFSLFKLRPPINVIYIDPPLVNKLVALNRETAKA